MARTQALMVYGASSKQLRRIVLPHEDTQLDDPAHIQPGEAGVRVPIGNIKTGDTHGQTLATALGLPLSAIPSSRHVVVSNGVVTDVIYVDPLIDDITHIHGAGASLVQHDQANIGDTYANSVWTPTPSKYPRKKTS